MIKLKAISRLLAAPVMALTMAVSSPSFAGDYDDAAVAYRSGDHETALSLLTKAAEQGYAEAQFRLGVMYANGEGVLQDYKASVRWYTKAAEQGNPAAQSNLGFVYESGEGVLQDYKAAVRWYTKAAEQGNSIGQNNLGVMYATGRGVLKNHVLAYMWFSIAASGGDEQGARNRGIAEGEMTPSQLQEAQRLAREWVAKH